MLNQGMLQVLSRAVMPRQVITAPARKKSLAPVDNRGGWWPIVRESQAGAWQANVTVSLEDALQYWAVFRCVSIIAGDVAKMRIKLVELDGAGIWNERQVAAFSPVLRKPNRYQTRIQFVQNWLESKLTRGNTYVLKQRDARGVVIGLRVLDPNRTEPLVSDSGEVFYRLKRDNLGNVFSEGVVVPASEIIHDRWNTLYHPLVGLSPIYACGVGAIAGLRIQNNTARLFTNGARPAGVLTAPGAIGDDTALRVKEYWDENFTGENAGKVAVLGDGLKYEAMTMTAVDAQLIEQLKWDDAIIAGTFGVPAYMINAGTAPAYNNVEALNQQYYSQCLQIHIEAIELCLDEGLGLAEMQGKTYGVEFDLEDLLRMDTATAAKTEGELVKAGIGSPNEARRRFNRAPVAGGETPYLQQQNYSLAALAKRDADDPFAKPPPAAPADEPDDVDDDEDEGPDEDATEKAFLAFRSRWAEIGERLHS